MEVVASLSQGRTAAAQCGLFTYKSVPVIFEPPSTSYGQCLTDGSSAGSPARHSVKYVHDFTTTGKCNNH